MYCPNCGNQVEENGQFCPFCGNRILNQEITTKPVVNKSKKNFKTKKILVVLLVLFIAGFGIYLGINKLFLKSGGQKIEEQQIMAEKKEESSDIYLAAVQNSEGKYGYINEKGQEVIACQFDYVDCFFSDNGLARVCNIDENGKGKWGIINCSGEIILPLIYEEISYSLLYNHNKFIPIELANGVDDEGNAVTLYGCVDHNGKIIIECEYSWCDYVWDESEYIILWKDETAYVFDEYGNQFPIEAYMDIRSTIAPQILFAQKEIGIAENGEKIGKWGVINTSGEVLVPFIYENLQSGFYDKDLKEFLIVANKQMDVRGKERYGLINSIGEEILPFEYISIEGFESREMIPVEKIVGKNEDGTSIYKGGCVNDKNEIVVPFEYEYMRKSFKQFVSVANENHEMGIVNADGKLITNYSENINGFLEVNIEANNSVLISFKIVNDSFVYGVIDSDGNYIVPFEYESIVYDEEINAFSVRNGNTSEFITLDGECLYGEYDYKSSFGNNGWMLVGNKTGTYTMNGEEIYKYYYIDKNHKIQLELSPDYVVAGTFCIIGE